MNNKTVCKYTIKLRGDNVYDLYVNDSWVASKGCYLNVLNEVKKMIESDDNNRCHCVDGAN